MSIKIGITGGIGSGKSVVSRLLKVMDIPVYDTDFEAKKLTSSHPTIRKELCELVGERVFDEGILNKSLLASYMFGHPDRVAKVNRIIHPRVKEHFRNWAVAHSHFPIVAIESAILIEAGFTDEVDTVLMVYAPLEVRIERAVKRDCSVKEQVLARINSQMSDEEKLKQANYLITNDNKTALMPQVLEFISFLSKNNH